MPERRAPTVGAEGHLDFAASEEEFRDDPIGDGVRRSAARGYVDGLDRSVGPLGRGGLDQPGESSAPGTFARAARCAEVAARVLKRHEEPLLGLAPFTARERPRRLERGPLDGDAVFLGGLAVEDALREDDSGRAARRLGYRTRVDSERHESRRDPRSDPGLVVDDFDASAGEEPGKRESGRRRGFEDGRKTRDAGGRRRIVCGARSRLSRRRRYSFFFARPSLSENFSMKATTSRSVLRLATSSRLTSLMSGI